jgi:Lon protease-like protein
MELVPGEILGETMERDVFDIPILPMPAAILFPHTLMRLHIDEPRQRLMVEHCLEGDRALSVGLIRPCAGSAARNGCSPIHRLLGVGRIVDHERLTGAKFHIKLEGLQRVMILRELGVEPYRRARVEVVKDRYDAERRAELAESRSRLEREMKRLAERLPRHRSLIERILSTSRHPGILADLAAANFVVDLYDRQSILAEYDVIRRVDLTAIQLETLNRRLRRGQPNPLEAQ